METPRLHPDRVGLRGSFRAAPLEAQPIGTADSHERTHVTVMVRSRLDCGPAVAQLAQQPPRQRQYMSRAMFTAQHGADPRDIEAVERFALEHGLLIIEASRARRAVVLEGTVDALGRAFGAEIVSFEMHGETFRGRLGSLWIPVGLDSIITGVFGLDERPQARTHFRRQTREIVAAAVAATSYTPPEIATAYSFPSGVDGSGQTIGIIELGGGYTASDLTTYFKMLGLPTPSVSSVSVDGATNAPTGTPDSADGEVGLDIEVIGAIATGAKIVIYFAPNTDQGFLDALTTAIHDANNAPTIISVSWGGPESSYTSQALTNFDSALADAVMLGMTVCVAVGDSGSSDGLTDGSAHVDFPASSPHVLACGGTSLELHGSTITRETVWNDTPNGGATGGGISAVFPLPSWQQNAQVPPSVNAGAKRGRGVPDVAADADPATGYTTIVDGQSGTVGGTSAVAPLWAALTALLNQKLGVHLGFLNPVLYDKAVSTFNDIVSGSNGAYSATTGWDACTGLGSPNGAKLVAALDAAPVASH